MVLSAAHPGLGEALALPGTCDRNVARTSDPTSVLPETVTPGGQIPIPSPRSQPRVRPPWAGHQVSYRMDPETVSRPCRRAAGPRSIFVCLFLAIEPETKQKASQKYIHFVRKEKDALS